MILFKKNFISISLGCVLVVACDSQANSNNELADRIDSVSKEIKTENSSKNKDISLNRLDTFFTPDKKMFEIDHELAYMETVEGFVHFDWQKDTLKLKLFLKKGKPAKLTYTTFDDGGIASGLGAYYFDSSGRVFANKVYYEDMEVIEVYLGNHEVLKYNKKENIHILQMNKEAQLYREATSVKALDDYMMVLNVFNYTAPKPSKDAWPILKVNQPVNLFESPDVNASVLLNMNKFTKLKYLGNNRKRSAVDQLTWAWYNVSTEDGTNGWVFGHPELVSEKDDENY